MSQFLADLVVAAHLAYIIFAALGGILVLRWPKLAWVHVPAVAWAVVNELTGQACPLTSLEDSLRTRFDGLPVNADRPGVVERYILPVLYPSSLTREIQVVMGSVVLLVNLVFYARIWRRARGRSHRSEAITRLPPPAGIQRRAR